MFFISCNEVKDSTLEFEKVLLVGEWRAVKYIYSNDTLRYYEREEEGKICFSKDSLVVGIFGMKLDLIYKTYYSVKNKGEVLISLYKEQKLDTVFSFNYKKQDKKLILYTSDSLNMGSIELIKEEDFQLMKRDLGCQICLLEELNSKNIGNIGLSLYNKEYNKEKFNDSLLIAYRIKDSNFSLMIDSLMVRFNFIDYENPSSILVIREKAESICLEKHPFNMRNTELRSELLKKYYFYSLLKSGNNKNLGLLKYIDKEKSSIRFKITGKKEITKEAKLMLMFHSRNYVVENCDVEKVKLELLEDSLLMKFSPSFKYWPDSLVLNSFILDD
jgi:hypothetical protein